MIHTPVIPNRQIIRILPSVSYLEIMIIGHQSDKPLKQMLALSLCHVIHLLNMVPESEDRLPPSNRVCAHNGMDGLEDFSNVFGCPTRFGVDLESILLGGGIEARLGIGGREGLKKFLVGS